MQHFDKLAPMFPYCPRKKRNNIVDYKPECLTLFCSKFLGITQILHYNRYEKMYPSYNQMNLVHILAYATTIATTNTTSTATTTAAVSTNTTNATTKMSQFKKKMFW